MELTLLRRAASLSTLSYYPKRWTDGARMRSKYRAEVDTMATTPFPWFVCTIEGVVHVVIQGSSDVNHWKSNLTVTPSPLFGGYSVHKGALDNARAIFDDLRLVLTGESRPVAFVGHSMGGALGLLVALLCVREGVIGASQVHRILMFGMPAIFKAPNLEVLSDNLLRDLNIPVDRVKNIALHFDVVPRCLPLLGYGFIGTFVMIQPNFERCAFCRQDGYHPHLPQRAGAFPLDVHHLKPILAVPHPLTTALSALKVYDYHSTIHYTRSIASIERRTYQT